jgi:hypothetical protein
MLAFVLVQSGGRVAPGLVRAFLNFLLSVREMPCADGEDLLLLSHVFDSALARRIGELILGVREWALTEDGLSHVILSLYGALYPGEHGVRFATTGAPAHL